MDAERMARPVRNPDETTRGQISNLSPPSSSAPEERGIISNGIKRRRVLLGNEAIAWGLLEAGATVLTSYPGTPASEILSSAQKIKSEKGLSVHADWCINEKVAFEIALTHSWLGGRSAVMMKQVGLNVALDPLMSAAYTGVRGGFLVISADDPGPYSSQTEQDSRFLAFFARIPVFDPATPQEAKEMVQRAFEISERFQIPVMLRPTSWVCHARQGVEIGDIPTDEKEIRFQRDPDHWAAPPRLRFKLHGELNRKVEEITRCNGIAALHVPDKAELAIVSSGVPFGHARDLIKSLGLEENVALYKVDIPYPLGMKAQEIVRDYPATLVLEESYPVIELQLKSREKVRGRLDGTIASEGELTAEVLGRTILQLLGRELPEPSPRPPEGSRPRLCASCPHRAAFWALKKALPGGIYPSDIGCYTLGINLGAVDTFLCMGTSVAQAEGLYLSFRRAGLQVPPIGATIGDSTFFHAGLPPLIDAVHQGACFVLMILDNAVTAMTGGQLTPASGTDGREVHPVREDGGVLKQTGLIPKSNAGAEQTGTVSHGVKIEEVVKGCGVEFVRIVDPYDVTATIRALQAADRYSRLEGRGVSVVISRRPCPLYFRKGSPGKTQVRINDRCAGCMICVKEFECPGIEEGEDGRPAVSATLCRGCGVCIQVCPAGAIERGEVCG